MCSELVVFSVYNMCFRGKSKQTVISMMCAVAWCLLLTAGAFQGVAATKCEKLSQLAAFEDHNTVVETSLKLLAGSWISEGCETRPGPEYVLRSYSFERDGQYLLIQHHYWDDSCSSPKLTISSHGRIILRNSLKQPGASSGTMKVTNISIIPQDINAADELDRLVAAECPGQYWRAWRRYEEHTVYDNKNEAEIMGHSLWTHISNSRGTTVHLSDISCLGNLRTTFNELKLLKIQLRPILENMLRKKTRQMKMELLLGDIHSQAHQRKYYNPSSFQVPLLKQTKGETVTINRHSYNIKTLKSIPTNVFGNSGKTPPHLIEKPHLPPYIWGQWTSVRCEVRPMGLYLLRHFSFASEGSKWTGEHKFFSDPFCIILKFTVTAAGKFALQEPNQLSKGASNIDFVVETATLTVMEQRMIHELRLPGFCGVGKWEVNVPQELSPTNGCIQLGIILPSTLFDVVKLEMDYKGACLLFMGQVDTDNMQMLSKERPTAFQLPMIKCGEEETYSLGLRHILDEPLYFNKAGKVLTQSYINMFLGLLIFYLLR